MNINTVCNEISKKLNLQFDIVKQIVMFEFKYTVDLMKDENDTRDILFNEAFKFKLKSRFKDNKSKNYSPNEQ